MLKFYSKYELQWKILATAAALFVAMDNFFFAMIPERETGIYLVGLFFQS